MPKKKWIQGLHIKKGAFKAKAKRAHMSTFAFAKKEQHAKGKLGREARLALTFRKLRKRRKVV